MAPLLKKIGSKSAELNVVQNYVAQAYDPLVKRVWVGDSVLLQDIELTQGSTNYVPHLLGRLIRGWEVVRRKARPGGYDEKMHFIGETGEPAFQNAWTNGSGAVASEPNAAFQAQPDGYIQLFGRIDAGAIAATPAFTLPVGFRPGQRSVFPVMSNGAFGVCTAETDGDIETPTGSNVSFWLNTVRFLGSGVYHAGAIIHDTNSDTTVAESLRKDFLLLTPTANCTIDLIVW